MIYNESLGYASMRTDIKDAYIGKQLHQLQEKSKVSNCTVLAGGTSWVKRAIWPPRFFDDRLY